MWAGCSATNEINSNLSMSRDVGSITGDWYSCQNENSALTTCVNRVDFALGHGGDMLTSH